MRSVLLCLAACFSIFGCKTHNAYEGATLSMEELGPTANPGPDAVLMLGDAKSGVKIPVDVVQKSDSTQSTYDLRAFDQSLETETYAIVGTQEFALKEAAGESFNPPLTLLKFPLKVGDGWSWKGMMSDGTRVDATATISTRPDKVEGGKNGSEDAILVEVKLDFNGGMKKPSERKLSFWFAKGLGVVKREIGSNSSRQWAPAAK